MTHYVIIRRDLPIGFAAAQIVHASGETSPGDLDSGTFAVVLAAEDESHLIQIANALRDEVIPFKLIREPDAPYLGAATAIGLWPTRNRKSVRKVLGRLPLLR